MTLNSYHSIILNEEERLKQELLYKDLSVVFDGTLCLDHNYHHQFLGDAPPPPPIPRPPPVAGSPPPVDGGPPPLAGGLPPVAGGPPPVAGGLPPVAGGPPPVDGGPPPLGGGLPLLAGGPPPLTGRPPPVAGGPPLLAGGPLPHPLAAPALHPAGAGGPLDVAALQRQRQLIIWQLRQINRDIVRLF
uniref:Uncharacterized protein n=1 Tax=Amphimedon queenslandica TaxID=400682 RepID=A0A1X7UYM9_AMPQE